MDDRVSWIRAFDGNQRLHDIDGVNISTVEAGEGDPIVFLHGNPTWSYMWRDVLPHVTGLGRCIAIDLVGMGLSDKLPMDRPNRYRLSCHREFLDAVLGRLDLGSRIILMMHDWGSALGFDWARRNSHRVAGMAYCEGIVGTRSWSDFPPKRRAMFELLRSDAGTEKVLRENYFIETVLPCLTLRHFSPEEMEMYRMPFAAPGDDRMATAIWPKELPIDGVPPDVYDTVHHYSEWLTGSQIPKLFIEASAGTSLVGRIADLCRTFPVQQEVSVHGGHYAVDDAPSAIGDALASFVRNVREITPTA